MQSVGTRQEATRRQLVMPSGDHVMPPGRHLGTQNGHNRVVVCPSVANKGRVQMLHPPLDPNVADIAPMAAALTAYDEEHLVTYLRLLDADSAGADPWRNGTVTFL